MNDGVSNDLIQRVVSHDAITALFQFLSVILSPLSSHLQPQVIAFIVSSREEVSKFRNASPPLFQLHISCPEVSTPQNLSQFLQMIWSLTFWSEIRIVLRRGTGAGSSALEMLCGGYLRIFSFAEVGFQNTYLIWSQMLTTTVAANKIRPPLGKYRILVFLWLTHLLYTSKSHNNRKRMF